MNTGQYLCVHRVPTSVPKIVFDILNKYAILNHDMNTTEQLEKIIPGKTYPSYAKVVDKGEKPVEFYLNSFYVGMYCAIHVDGHVAVQTGDHDNKRFCRMLKEDLNRAIARGADVEIGSICECKLTMD